jgi:hypothetical protein
MREVELEEKAQKRIKRRPELTVKRWRSRLIVAARQLLAQAAWQQLARVLGGECGIEGGLYRLICVAKGAGDHNEFEEIFVEISQGRVVFVPISLGGMTSGALGSATEGEGKSTISRGEGKWVVGCIQHPG